MVSLFTMALALSVTSSVLAKVPGPNAIRAAWNRGAKPALKAPWVVTLMEVAPPSSSPPKAGTPPFLPTWRIRLQMSVDGTLAVDRENLVEGTIARERFGLALPQKSLPPPWIRVLVEERPASVVTSMGLAKRTSLARAGRSILWVWGAGPRNRSIPQVHVQRATGRLHRLIVGGVDATYRGILRHDGQPTRWPRSIALGAGKKATHYSVRLITAASFTRPPTEGAKSATPKTR